MLGMLNSRYYYKLSIHRGSPQNRCINGSTSLSNVKIDRVQKFTQWVWVGYREIRNTSCVSFVVACDTTDTTTVSYFAVNHEEGPLCELFITRTYSNSARFGSSFECEVTTKT